MFLSLGMKRMRELLSLWEQGEATWSFANWKNKVARCVQPDGEIRRWGIEEKARYRHVGSLEGFA
jgi:hypothetical protein